MTTITTHTNGVRIATGRRLDIGAGAKREDGWETMDISPVYAPDFQHDLTRFPWPFDDGTFEEVRCWHVLEHIDRQHLIPVMNEMHRILVGWGEAEIEVPVFPHWKAIADPTHISFFVPQTFDYFCDERLFGDHMKLYGIKPWKHVQRFRLDEGQIVRVRLAKVPG